MPDEDDPILDDPVVVRERDYPGGFEDFFRAEYRRIVEVLMVIEGACLTEADDCVAYAMEKLFMRWHLPRSHAGYVYFPRAYAVQTARRQFRKERCRVQAVELDDIEPVLAADEPALTMLENRQLVADILEYLPSGQRQVMHLIAEGYALVEIATILGKQPNNVRQIAYQAKKRLRPLLRHPATELTRGEDEKS